MSLWDTLKNDWSYLKAKVTPSPSFNLQKVEQDVSNFGRKLQPMATNSAKAFGNFMLHTTPIGGAVDAYKAVQQFRSPQGQQQFNNFKQYINNPANTPQWLQKTNQNLYKFSQGAENFPKFNFADKVQNPVLRFGAEIPQQILNIPSNAISNVFQGYGHEMTPSYMLKRAGGAINTGVDIGSLMIGGPEAKALLVGGAKTLGKQGLKEAMLQGAKREAILGGKIGLGYGIGGGLQQGDNPREQLLNALKGGIENAPLGALFGGTVGGISPAVGAGARKLFSGSHLPEFSYNPAKNLSPQDQAIESKFGAEIQQNLGKAISSYKKKFGNVLNTDNVRELSADYMRNKGELSSAVHEPASALTKLMYSQKLAEPLEKGKKPWVVFTAGGSGTGKSTSIEKLPLFSKVREKARLVYDTNLNNTGSAVEKINQALDAGNKVNIFYVHRDPMEAFTNGVVPRSNRIGRTVPIQEHINTNFGAPKTIKELSQIYKDNPNVSIKVINNSNGAGKATPGSLDLIDNLSYNVDRTTQRLIKTVKKLYEQNQISKDQYKGFFKGLDRQRIQGAGELGTQGANGQLEQAGLPKTSEIFGQGSQGPIEPNRIQFVSPNVAEGMNLDQALGELKSPRHSVIKQGVSTLDQQHGIKSTVSSAIGDWKDGSENTLVSKIYSDIPDEQAQYNLAHKGLLANQKDVIDFKFSPQGKDEIFTINTAGKDSHLVKDVFEKNGVEFKTLGRNEAYVVNKGGDFYDPEMMAKMQKIEGELGTTATLHKGQATFLTNFEEDRGKAQQIYQDIINKYDQKYGQNSTTAGLPKSSEANPIYRTPLQEKGQSVKDLFQSSGQATGQEVTGGIPILKNPGESGYQLPLIRSEHFASPEPGPMKLLEGPKKSEPLINILKPGKKPIALRETPNSITPTPAGRGGISMPDLNFGNWKDKKAWTLGRETLDRNIDEIAGAEAPKVKALVTEPITKNETNRAQWLTDQRTEIENEMKRLGIKKNSVEDKLVQKFGEGQLDRTQLKQQTPKWQQVEEASKIFRDKYDQYLDQINSVRQKFGYEPIPKRKDYFRHFQDIGNVIEQMGLIGRKQDLPTSIAGISDIFKPGKPFTTAELRRKGVQTKESAIGGVDDYLQSVSNQIFHTDSVQRVRNLEKYIRTKSLANELLAQGYSAKDANLRASEQVKNMMTDVERGLDAPESVALPNFVSNISEYGNLLAGKKARLDRAFESTLGRGFYKVMNGLRSRTSGNMVGANVSSALTNFIPFTQSMATTGKKAVAKGLLEATASPFKADFAEIGGVKSGFLTRRFPKGDISPTLWESTKHGANWIFEAVDHFTSKAVVAGKYYENLDKGMKPAQAMKLADEFGAKVMTDRSWGQLPNLMNTRSLGPITQFQAEINNMWSFVKKDIPNMSEGSKAKMLSSLAQFTIYSYLFNNMFQTLTGRRPTIDPIYGVGTMLGVTDAGKDKPLGKRTFATVQDIAGNLPFVGGITGGRLPISAGLPDIAGLAQGKTTLGKELTKPLAFIAPPFGGLQMQKTLQGLGSFGKGYQENASGKIQYPVDQNVGNFFRGAVFGKSAFPEANQYYNRNNPVPLSDQQTQNFKMGGGAPYYNQVMAGRDQTQNIKGLKDNIKNGATTSQATQDQGLLGKIEGFFGGGQPKQYTPQDYAEAYGYKTLFTPPTSNQFGQQKQIMSQKTALIRMFFDDKVPEDKKLQIYKELGVTPKAVEHASMMALPTAQKAPFIFQSLKSDPRDPKQKISAFIAQGMITKAMTLEWVKQGMVSPQFRTTVNKMIDQHDIYQGIKAPPKGKTIKFPKFELPAMTSGGSARSGLTMGQLLKVK